MANPRPCVCGHPASKHGSGFPAFGNRCIACYFSPGDWSGCIYYRPVPREEPLRARRGWTRVVLRPSTVSAQSWGTGESVEWTVADINDDLSRYRDTLAGKRPCDVELRLDDGRVLTVNAEWKNGGWHIEVPPEAQGQGVQVRLKVRAPAS